jgi:hypothetical protein
VALCKHRQPHDEQRPETLPVQTVGDLDCDFRAAGIELDAQRVPDDLTALVEGQQAQAIRPGGSRQMRGRGDVDCSGEEAKPSGRQA